MAWGGLGWVGVGWERTEGELGGPRVRRGGKGWVGGGPAVGCGSCSVTGQG